MSLYYEKNLISNAKYLRKNMTRQERHLWYDFLSKYPIKFQRQKVIDNYIVDFYCHKAKLAIELDGSQHYSDAGVSNDEKRTQTLKQYGLTVMRFSNLDIDRNFDAVRIAIDDYIKSL
ncbi:MAG: endonuclease domain-containing protein [Clostridia bacterium]|nr:endonuclease domain-containing protein [Clostridia bacterium]